MNISKVKAVAEVFQGGTRVTGAVLAACWENKPCAAVPGDFQVEQVAEDGTWKPRRVTGVRKGENDTLVLSLDPSDPCAATYFSGDPWQGRRAKIIPAKLRVNGVESDAEENRICDRFVTGTFENIGYSLYLPENLEPGKTYPLVQFIHDASACGNDPRLGVRQGYGAVSFADPESQKKYPCFVLCPQFDIPAIVDDDWHVDGRLERAERLLEKVISDYPIDRKRIYTTGQSMGCMSSMVLNLRHPDLFAASFFVAGQWDERAFVGANLAHKHFWFFNSQGDAKAFPGMNQILAVLEREGAKVARMVWDAGCSQEDYRKLTDELLAEGADMIYTPLRLETVADGWHSFGGEHHVETWRYAYRIDAIRDWLFAQSL